MSKNKAVGRPKGSRNKPKRPGFYKLSPQQITEFFSDAPYVLVSKDWLLNKVGDTKLFDTYFQETPSIPNWKVQEL